MVPQAVIRELDGLKKSADGGTSMRARRAANFVLDAVKRRSEWIKVVMHVLLSALSAAGWIILLELGRRLFERGTTSYAHNIEWFPQVEDGFQAMRCRPDNMTASPDDRILQFAASMGVSAGAAGRGFLHANDGGHITLVRAAIVIRFLPISGACYRMQIYAE
jgi:hypothetical protein